MIVVLESCSEISKTQHEVLHRVLCRVRKNLLGWCFTTRCLFVWIVKVCSLLLDDSLTNLTWFGYTRRTFARYFHNLRGDADGKTVFPARRGPPHREALQRLQVQC